ncbi:MAG TPA: alkaline phosphatase [Deltaproteobacteria bacterium]|nr:alkaline phosphatase [Deltaproteobacteria bacterium]
MGKKALRVPAAVLVCVIALIFLYSAPAAANSQDRHFRNVIILVGDGMGSAHTTLARWYKGSPLAFDAMNVGGIRTYGADSLITDSAPAATAFACGHKSTDKSIGIMPCRVTIPGVPDPGPSRCKPIASVLEGAKLTGRAVGLVATSNIQHATPAAYSSHWPDRANFNEIARQQVYQNMDVIFGGGKRYLLPREKGGTRTDGEDLLDVARSKGYAIVTDREQMVKAASKKVWGAFADDAMAYEFDRRRLAPAEPGLSEMTRKAIEILSKNKKGFFLFVEGSKIDWAAHAHDPIGVIGDVLAFEEAVRVALDFAKTKGGTLVVALADHATGGMSLGSKQSDGIYSKLQYEAVLAPLKKASLTGEGVEKMLKGDLSEGNIKNVVAEYLGITDLSAEEIGAIQSAKTGRFNNVLGPIVSRRTYIGWTTSGHTGEDIFFYYHGIGKPLVIMQNTEIALMAARAMGFDLTAADKRLFTAADKAFEAVGVSTTIDKKDPGNMLLVVEAAGKKAELPLGKNVMRIAGKTETNHTLEGVTVLAPETGTVYIPAQAVEIFKKAK